MLLIPLLAIAASSATAARRDCSQFAGDRWDQRLSFAACLRTARPARVTDPEQLRGYVAHLAASVDQPVEIYRDAIARGPLEVRLLAAYQLGETYLDLVVRARSSVPPELIRDLDPLLVGFERQAAAGFTSAWAIGNEIPSGVPADEVVRNIIADTRTALETL